MFNSHYLSVVGLVDSLVKPLFVGGTDYIVGIQADYEAWQFGFGIFHQLTDPWIVYFFLFPIVYYNSMRMGVRIVWAAAVTEYVCIILKLMFHGHRPYWYANESLYHIATPKIKQYGWTCATSPGSPSHRTMVTACITHILVQHYCKCKGISLTSRWVKYGAIWAAYYGVQFLILVSGAFAANTFPHQSLIGTVLGSLMARRLARTNVLEISLAGFVWMITFMLATFYGCYAVLCFLGYDPGWAMAKASLNCMKISWVETYRNPLIENLFRASGFILGLGLATRFFTKKSLKVTDGCTTMAKMVHMCVGCILINVFDAFLQPPMMSSAFVYYMFLFVKYIIPPMFIITDIPFVTGISKLLICEIVDRDDVRSRYSTQLGGDPMIPHLDSVCSPDNPLNTDECCHWAPTADQCCNVKGDDGPILCPGESKKKRAKRHG